jgi:hypothetical protein
MSILVVIAFPLIGILIALAIAYWETRLEQSPNSSPFDWEQHSSDDFMAELISLPPHDRVQL